MLSILLQLAAQYSDGFQINRGSGLGYKVDKHGIHVDHGARVASRQLVVAVMFHQGIADEFEAQEVFSNI